MQALVDRVIHQLAGPDLDSTAIRVGSLPPAHGDPTLLQQVWQNLIANAIKFTAGVTERSIVIGCESRNEGPVYFVRDNGTGFDMAHADKLFALFQRLHGADEYPGLGVGLATAKRAIDRHGGEIWAESSPGKGATFLFRLPR